ncbi:MAG: hypothetical protein OHK0026_01510 [Rhodocyclaceae bacterium]
MNREAARQDAAAAPRGWLRLVRPGDWATVVASALAVAALWLALGSSAPAERAQIRVRGILVAELPLTMRKTVEVTGPLGITRIEVEPGRARVASDPGPRQYCVRQGWLDRPNAIAICAPNEVSLSLAGSSAAHDTVNY